MSRFYLTKCSVLFLVIYILIASWLYSGFSLGRYSIKLAGGLGV